MFKAKVMGEGINIILEELVMYGTFAWLEAVKLCINIIVLPSGLSKSSV